MTDSPAIPQTALHDGPGDLALRLAAIPGLDAESGLACVRGRIASYARLLRLYAENQAADAPLLKAALAAGDFADVRRRAHSLKGASGTLGLKDVQAAAAALEAGLQEENCPAPRIELLADRLETLWANTARSILDCLPSHAESAPIRSVA